MTTITEDYVSFEVAKLLKEKGFDELCIFKYSCEGIRMKAGISIDEWQNSELDENEYSAPTLQMTMKWLREVQKIFICPLFVDDSNCYGYTIESLATKKYLATSGRNPYESYEQAAKASILHSSLFT